MEQSPTDNETIYDQRPPLDIDLRGPDGNVFMVIGMARQQLEGEPLKDFNRAIWEATQPGSGVTYDGILAIVNSYTDLLDTSGIYPKYGPEAHITAAVERLNDRLQTLPGGICEIGGLYPEFDKPDLGPDKYAMLLVEEAERVEGELMRAGEDEPEDLLRLRAMLLDSIWAIRRALAVWQEPKEMATEAVAQPEPTPTDGQPPVTGEAV